MHAPLLFEMRVCFTEQHCKSWPSRVVRDYLIIFRILDAVSSLTIICLEYGLGYAILSAFYFVQAILSIQFSIHHRKKSPRNTGTIAHRKIWDRCNTANWDFIHCITASKKHQHRNTANPHVPLKLAWAVINVRQISNYGNSDGNSNEKDTSNVQRLPWKSFPILFLSKRVQSRNNLSNINTFLSTWIRNRFKLPSGVVFPICKLSFARYW